MKKYSFVIPTYQSKNILKNSLEALNYQKGYKGDYEVIVVDDGSTDGTYDYINGINRNFDLKYIYLERCSESCRSRARNYGIRQAEGEIIIFIDADTIVREDYLSQLDRCYTMDKNIVVVGERILIPQDIRLEIVQDGSAFEKYVFDCKREELLEFRYMVFNELSYNASAIIYPFLYAQSCNLAVPKKWIEKINGFDEDLKKWGLEDIETAYRLYKEGLKIVINSKLEVLHQFHGVQGYFVDEDKIAGVEENTRLFLEKHTNIFNIPENMVYELFNSLATRFNYVEKKFLDNVNRIIVEFKDKNYLNDIKDTIIMLSDKNDIEIIVNDYVEDTDLDLWIQLLGKRNSTPKYFPVSRKLTSQTK